ncbi:MAG TPA: hypothetical protein VFU47_01960, partial [Armatimonadota bacterium]|nr:hypothetical protein [Armatimonadota bacterium]
GALMLDLTAVVTIPTTHVWVRAVRVDGQWVGSVEWSLPPARTGQETERGIVSGFHAQDGLAYFAARTGEEVETAVLKAAWALGAWDCVRWLKYAIPADADPFAPQWGLTRAFRGFDGVYQVAGVDGSPLKSTFLEGEALRFCDPADMVRAAARGYVQWLFKPMAQRKDMVGRHWRSKDRTLGEQGWRDGSCPLVGFPLDEVCEHAIPCGSHSAEYRFGRSR